MGGFSGEALWDRGDYSDAPATSTLDGTFPSTEPMQANVFCADATTPSFTFVVTFEVTVPPVRFS